MHKNVFYLNDLTNSGRSDYWQSAFETVATGVGDCEDYAIAKYVALRALDVPAEQLEFTVGKLQNRGAHAVLLARTPEGPRLLDNLRVDVEPIERCRDFLPIYSANENSAYLLNSNSFSRIGKKKLRNLSKVYDVLLRSQAMLKEEARQRLRNAD
jgi:predicted transglutaminase-like cysteine proteinase